MQIVSHFHNFSNFLFVRFPKSFFFLKLLESLPYFRGLKTFLCIGPPKSWIRPCVFPHIYNHNIFTFIQRRAFKLGFYITTLAVVAKFQQQFREKRTTKKQIEQPPSCPLSLEHPRFQYMPTNHLIFNTKTLSILPSSVYVDLVL